MGTKDLAWKNFLEHEEIVKGLLELAVEPAQDQFQELTLRRMPTHEALFEKDGHQRQKAVGRERDGCWRMSWRQPNGQRAQAILGIEVQSGIDPSMAVRVAVADVMNYNAQAEAKVMEAKIESQEEMRDFLYPALPEKPLELVVTLVIYTGKQAWDARCSLRQMVDVPQPFTLDDVPGFQFRLLDLRRIPEKKLVNGEKNSRSVIKYLKVHEDKEALRRLVKSDEDYQVVLVDTARVIQAVTGAQFKIPNNEEYMNMCKAEQDLCDEAARLGEARGEERGIQQGIRVYVSKLRQLGVAEKDILAGLSEDFHLSLDKALEYLR